LKSDLLLAVTQLAAERNLPRGVVLSPIAAALVSAYKRDTVTRGHDVAVELKGDGSIILRTFRTVVEEVEEPGIQISVEEARQHKPDAAPGDVIYTGEIEGNPGRIAAQTAKQVLMQRLREAERDLVFDEYADKAGEVISAVIQRVEPRQVIVDLGRAEALLPPSEQVQFEGVGRHLHGNRTDAILKSAAFTAAPSGRCNPPSPAYRARY
jgi:transcription termination/antitermination protein NusA